MATSNKVGAERVLSEVSDLLAMRVTIAVPDWVRRCVERGLLNAWYRTGGHWSLTDEDVRLVLRNGDTAGWRAAQEVGSKLWSFLLLDVDGHCATPLEVVRQAVPYPAEVLRQAGIPPAKRDRLIMKLFPDDVYDLMPRSLAALPELAHAWEQAKVAVLQCRHGAFW
jgi:hypothetical protein